MATTTNYLLPNGTDIGTLFQPFTSTSTSIFSTTQILSLATNSTGSILAGVAKNSATMYYSSDSGTNWGTAITLPITATHIAISDNGTYQLICGHNSTYNYYAYSTSGGGAGTWTAKVMPGSTGLNISVPTGVAISSLAIRMLAAVKAWWPGEPSALSVATVMACGPSMRAKPLMTVTPAPRSRLA